MSRAPVTNERVATDLGISESMVSRIRSGNRHPSVTTMKKITEVTRWKIQSQSNVWGTPAYAAKFEECLARHYNLTIEREAS